MRDHRAAADIELLARMAARLARGRDARPVVDGEGPNDDGFWRSPEFLTLAKAAYATLASDTLILKPNVEGGYGEEGESPAPAAATDPPPRGGQEPDPSPIDPAAL